MYNQLGFPSDFKIALFLAILSSNFINSNISDSFFYHYMESSGVYMLMRIFCFRFVIL